MAAFSDELRIDRHISGLSGIWRVEYTRKQPDFPEMESEKAGEVISKRGCYSLLLGTKNFAFATPKISEEWKTNSTLAESDI